MDSKREGHEFLVRDALFLQAIDVDFSEDAAFPGHGVPADAGIGHPTEFIGRDPQLRGNLVQHGAGAAGAFVVHRGQLTFLAGASVLLEDNDLGVLPAQLDDAVGFRVEGLDGQGDGVYLLNVPRPHAVADRGAPGARNKNPEVLGRGVGERPPRSARRSRGTSPAGGSHGVDSRARGFRRSWHPTRRL